MRRVAVILGMFLCMASSHAQTFNRQNNRKELDEFRKETRQDFAAFRKECMDEYIAFVRNPWKEFEENLPIPLPKEKELPPVVIPKKDKQKPIKPKPIDIDVVVKPVPVPPQPKPIVPIKEVPSPTPEVKQISFDIFGTHGKVRFDTQKRVHLAGLEEEQVADALSRFTQTDYDNLIFDCLKLREQMQLSDWAYLQMLKIISDKISGGDNNDSALLLTYLLMQSGYRTRLAHDGEKLYMLYASEHYIYEKLSFTLDGRLFYGVHDLPNRLYISQASFPKEKSLSLLVSKSQKFELDKSDERSISAALFKDMKINVAVNKNLINFYNTYPASMLDNNFITKWAMYANTPLDESTKGQIYPQLKELLKGHTQLEAAERLLNLVQTGFTYEYDDKLWGRDRAFFSEETLFYPFCDCEDRSILLTRLVRDLLGLKCVLIYYPGHLASAIEFTEGNVNGDYVMLDNHKYIIADGTYINASIGRTMPGMDNKTATAILLE